jgi:hypothetical protein
MHDNIDAGYLTLQLPHKVPKSTASIPCSPFQGLLLGVAVDWHWQICCCGRRREVTVWLLHVAPDGLQTLKRGWLQQRLDNLNKKAQDTAKGQE